MTLSLEDVMQDMRRLCPPVGDWVESWVEAGRVTTSSCSVRRSQKPPGHEGTLCPNTHV